MPKGIYSNPEERARKISETKKTGKYFNCLICNNKFWRKQYAIKHGENKFCSKECYFRWQKGKPRSDQHKYKCSLRVGNKNLNWQGGKTTENHKARASKEYSNWRKSVFERDDYTCQKCGVKSKKNCYVRIEAHHIKPFATFPELRFVIDNGITLCKKCHDKEPKGREILCLN